MDVRHLIGFILTGLVLCIPANASGATCAGSSMLGAAGEVEVVTGCGDASAGAIARALGIDPADLDRMGAATEIPSGKVVRLEQAVNGVPVLNGQVALTYDRAGNLDMVQSSAIPEPDIATVPRVSAADAIAVSGLAGGRPELVIYPGEGRPILAWHVERAAIDSHLNAIVDARTGLLVRSWDAIFDATANTPTFNPNPVQDGNDLALDDGADLDTGPDAHAVTRTLDLLDSATAIAGPYAEDTNPLAAPGDASRTAMLPDGATDFESANVYYALTEAQRKIQELGFTDVNNRIQGFNVNLLADDNSNYNSLTKDLTFGSGGVDDAEDADVVLHEYGHSIQDDQVPGFGSGDEQGAMGEGFGDFFAGMYYLDKGNATYQANRRYCIAEWDATSYNPFVAAGDGSGCLRWIDGTDESTGADIGKYSNTPSEVHDDGRYWSAGMTCVFEGLGGNATARDKVLRLVLDSQQGLVPVDDNTAFEKQITAMIISDQNLYSGADVQLIRNCADQRGLASLADTNDSSPPEVTAVVDPAAPDGKNGIYTRDVRVTWTVADPQSAVATSGCDPVTIATDTPLAGMTLTCTATSVGGMTTRSTTIRRLAAEPNTNLTKHPRKRTKRKKARFKFTADLEGTTFKCSLDGERFSACDSPQKVKVDPGKHTFEVQATSVAGKTESKPASFSWKVKQRKRR